MRKKPQHSVRCHFCQAKGKDKVFKASTAELAEAALNAHVLKDHQKDLAA